MDLSSNETNNTDLKWSKYSPDSEDFFDLKSEKNMQELVRISYKEKQIGKLVQSSGLLLFYGISYYTWNIWRWFTPEFMGNLSAAFILNQTDQEETSFKGWGSYLVRTKPRQTRQYFQESTLKIIEDWTFETTLRFLIFPLGILIGCLQASYLRYSFLRAEPKSSWVHLSWQDFKGSVPKGTFGALETQKLVLYDQFLLVSSNENPEKYCISLPASVSHKNIFLTLKQWMKRPSGKKVLTKSTLGTPSVPGGSVQLRVEHEKIKLKNQYKRNLFRQLRTRALANHRKLPEITFYHDPKHFYPGFLSSLSFVVHVYAVLFPLWFLGDIWFRLTNTAVDIRKTKAKKVSRSQNKKRFSDLAGIEKLVPDLNELVQSLQPKKTQSRLSIYAPKGYILVGPPGTGKTLLAQAIAGESQVTFFFTSGSEFVENQNGIGPARLRDLFRKAKKETPSIIFMDEIDTLGKRRTGSVTSLNNVENGGQDEEKIQLLTEFLIQMDGFSKRNDLIVIGATNFFELLDPAFIRPGRFDRIFQLELPTKAVRVDILKLHASKNGFDSSIPWNYFGRMTEGFSGADLSAIVNESLLNIIRGKQKVHTLETLQHGLERISTYSKQDTLRKVGDLFTQIRKAYYQAGIGVIYSLVEELPNPLALELSPRPKNLRYVKLDQKVKRLAFEISNKKILEARILGCLAGTVSEFYVFHELSSLQKKGDSFWFSQQGIHDLEKATKLAKTMIEDYGMFGHSLLALSYNPLGINSTSKRFNLLESYSYNNVWNSLQEDFLRFVNEEEDREKPIRMNWRFLSFWSWQLTSQNLYAKDLPKWGKSYIDEKAQEDQEILVGDDYFHKNQMLEYEIKAYEKRDQFIQSIIKHAFERVLVYLKTNRNTLDFIAYSLLEKDRLREDEILEMVSKTSLLPDKTFAKQQKVVNLFVPTFRAFSVAAHEV